MAGRWRWCSTPARRRGCSCWIAAAAPIATPAVSPGVISDLLWHPSRNEVAFNLAGARSFSDVYSVDATRGRLDRWTWSEMGGANPETLPDAEVVTWKSFDGLEIPACSTVRRRHSAGRAP